MLLALALLHGRYPLTPGALWSAWTFDPVVLFPLVYGPMLYAHGVRNVWRSAGRGRGIRVGQAASFTAGVVVMLVAQVSPIAAMGGALFAAHMTQHILIMSVAAPLLVFGAPGIAFAWALPPRTVRAINTRVLHRPWFRHTLATLTRARVAWTLHALAIWLWHVPTLYSATVSSSLLHGLQHFSFFATAVLFWWVLQRRSMQFAGVLYLFTTAVHSSLLGALLVFERSPLYAPYVASAQLWGLSPLEDQQLGGLIMWVPAGLVYVGAALALMAALLRHSSSRAPRLA